MWFCLYILFGSFFLLTKFDVIGSCCLVLFFKLLIVLVVLIAFGDLIYITLGQELL